MKKIAIIDDNINDQKATKENFEKYYPQNVEIDIFNQYSQDMGYYDLYFIDIDMPDINGFEIAEELASQDRNVLIVFVTNKDNLVFKSFKFNPFSFIRKRNIEEDMEEAILKYMDYCRINDYSYTCMMKNEVYQIEYRNILYFEKQINNLIIHLANGKELLERKSINKLCSELKKEVFVRSHTSFYVNLHYIEKLNKNTIYLVKGIELPISKKFKASTEKKYIEYMIRGY